MNRRSAEDEIRPATVAGSLAARILDLDAMVAAGYGLKPLLSLPLRCGDCGGRGHGVIVDGAHLGVSLGS